MQHSTRIGSKNKALIVLFSSLALGLTACGGGGSKKAEPAKTGFIATDFEKQVYVSKEDNSATTFLAGQTGIEYSDEGVGNGGTYPFTWAIDNEKLDVIYNTGGTHYKYTFKSVDGNKYVGVFDDSNETPYDHILYKAKPLNLTDLDGKILAFDVSDDSDCSARTIKITGNAVNMKEVCTSGNSEFPMTLSTVSNLDNTLELGFTKDGTPRTVMMVLIEGSIAQSGTVAFIHKKNSIFTSVELETITATDKEAEPTTNPPANDSTFQVVNKKLVMKSETSDTGTNKGVLYGFTSTAQNPTYLISMEADLSLIESSITGDGRARIAYYQKMESLSTNDVASIFVAIDHRASGIASRAYLNINGVETPISGIHKKTLEKGKSYHFKIDSTGSNLTISIAGYTASIPKSSVFSSGDIYVSDVSFQARVRNAEAGNFAKGSVDNIVLKRDKSGDISTITRDFNDGVTPVADGEFNTVIF